MYRRLAMPLAFALASLASQGCLERELSPLDPCAKQGTDQEIRVDNVGKVDVLFVVDNSGSMEQEQRALRAQLPRLVGVLASGDLEFGQDDPRAGLRDFPPVRDLHVGVVSTDMGTGGFAQDSCEEPVFGDDGVLQNRGNQAMDPALSCLPSYDRFLAFANEEGDRCALDEEGNLPAACREFADAFQCISALGKNGCGFEQQLEATLKALVPDTRDCVEPHCSFFMGTRGHGNDAATNGGFLRPDSLLAVIILTDEEDCSAEVVDLFNERSNRFFGNANVRCTDYPTALHPIERYVDGLLSLRADPTRLVYAVIAGARPELVRVNTDTSGIQDFDAILADPSMVPQANATRTDLVSSCTSANGEAKPPRRLVQLARDLQARGANAIVQSICQSDFTPVLDSILTRIAGELGSCLPRALNPDAAGRVSCDVVELLPSTGDVTRCDQLPGRRRVGAEAGRELCEVRQVPATNDDVREDEAGWFYDDFTTAVSEECSQFETAQRIAYIPGSEPVTGTDLRLQCLQSVLASDASGASADRGVACAPFPFDGDLPEVGFCGRTRSLGFARANVCDPGLRECQAPCGSTADCAPGYLCDMNRQAIEDRSSPIVVPRPLGGGACGVGQLPNPDDGRCVGCVDPYVPRVAAGEEPACVRPCAADTDCDHAGLPFGICLAEGLCSLPRICVNPTCQ